MSSTCQQEHFRLVKSSKNYYLTLSKKKKKVCTTKKSCNCIAKWTYLFFPSCWVWRTSSTILSRNCFFLSKQFCICNLHRSTHNRRINLCVKALLNAGQNLQIMHCNTSNINKSTSHPLLTTTNPQHLDIQLWGMQVATCAFLGASCEASTFDTLNKTTFFFNHWTQKI
jgi:hypothetical protein